METRCLHRQYRIYPNEWKYFFFLKTKFSVIRHAFFISECNLLKIENSYPKQKIICYLKKKLHGQYPVTEKVRKERRKEKDRQKG